jgi:hypothetical protein
MRTGLTAILVLLSAAAAASAQGWADKMFEDGLSHDFGTVARGTQLKHSFTITNIYAVRMEITEIKSGCGCVSATAAKRVLEPHEKTTIDVSMDGKRFQGPKTVWVRVKVGPDYVSTAELKVSANSRGDVVLNPGEVSFGSVTQGQTPTKEIDVEYAGVVRWQVTDVVVGDAPYAASVKETYRKQGQVGYRLTVTLKSDAPAGVLKHTLYLKTNDQASPTVPVLVEATVQSSLTAAPSPMNLGTVKVGETYKRLVVVRGGKIFRVTGVDGLGEGIDLASAPAGTESEVQYVNFKCTFDKPGPFRRELKIKTNAQDAPVTVVIEGTAK